MIEELSKCWFLAASALNGSELVAGGQKQQLEAPFVLQLSCRQGAPGPSALQWQVLPLWCRSRKSGIGVLLLLIATSITISGLSGISQP